MRNILLEYIEAVEYNNEINFAHWSDWQTGANIIKTYKLNPRGLSENIMGYVEAALDALIIVNGDRKTKYMLVDTLDILNKGV